jgi:hypothetical protein
MALDLRTRRSLPDSLPVQPRLIWANPWRRLMEVSGTVAASNLEHREWLNIKFQVQFLLFPFHVFLLLYFHRSFFAWMLHKIEPRWCRRWILGDVSRTTRRVRLSEQPSLLIFFLPRNFARYFIWSVGTNPWRICNYRLLLLQVVDVINMHLDKLRIAMAGEWKQGSDDAGGTYILYNRLVSVGQLKSVFHLSWFSFTIASCWLYIYY